MIDQALELVTFDNVWAFLREDHRLVNRLNWL